MPPSGGSGPLTSGRTAHLIAGPLERSRRPTLICTLVGSAGLNGWDPYAQLRILLGRIADHPIDVRWRTRTQEPAARHQQSRLSRHSNNHWCVLTDRK